MKISIVASAWRRRRNENISEISIENIEEERKYQRKSNQRQRAKASAKTAAKAKKRKISNINIIMAA